ncbi:hypothetical protein HELRODRAFT_176276 [Helobdella robusta]|uniref:Uncharacterized protein n=1 Tax=Helobdella robusta TaxID=6412 RepID=T1FAC9_HELRO|nr:hypothetical protein HELRODRAFT_176276 [Helobdella robusta]ESN99975.1 hypothetical protein HELRODRAFT_176276 [Helobdella robusta]
MATAEKEEEIDEFAMFKARSLGVESEYLELARSGLLRKSIKKVPLGATKRRENDDDDYDDVTQRQYGGNNRNVGRDDVENNNFLGSDIGGCGAGLHRAHSYRASRRSPREGRPEASGEKEEAEDEATSSGKLSRQRNMTMPSRRKGEQQRPKQLQQLQQLPPEPPNALNDRSVLRVRNFSTKDGNIINRGDSIKIRKVGDGLAGARPRSCRAGSSIISPLARDQSKHFFENNSININNNLMNNNRSGSLRGVHNNNSSNVNNNIHNNISNGSINKSSLKLKTTAAAAATNKNNRKLYSNSASHLAITEFNYDNNNDDDDDINDSSNNINKRNKLPLKNSKFSRQFQSQDDDHAGKRVSGKYQQQQQSHQQQYQQQNNNIQATTSLSASTLTTKQRHINNINNNNNHTQHQTTDQLNDNVCEDGGHVTYHNGHHQENDGGVNNDDDDDHNNILLQNDVTINRSHDEDDVVVYKVVVMGMTGVGKTTLTHQMLTSEYLANNENNDMGIHTHKYPKYKNTNVVK